VGGATTDFLYDGVNPVQEVDGPTVIANLLTGLGVDEYFTRTDVAWQQNLLPDALGSTIALTDAIGLVATEYTYEPFGSTTVGGAATTNSFQYTARENDGIGLYYYRGRYYSPGFQRFTSEDPIGFNGGINLFSYVGNAPVNFTDPFGLKPDRTCSEPPKCDSGYVECVKNAGGPLLRNCVMLSAPFAVAGGGIIGGVFGGVPGALFGGSLGFLVQVQICRDQMLGLPLPEPGVPHTPTPVQTCVDTWVDCHAQERAKE
jgi:RHS repeat-associated protein